MFFLPWWGNPLCDSNFYVLASLQRVFLKKKINKESRCVSQAICIIGFNGYVTVTNKWMANPTLYTVIPVSFSYVYRNYVLVMIPCSQFICWNAINFGIRKCRKVILLFLWLWAVALILYCSAPTNLIRLSSHYCGVINILFHSTMTGPPYKRLVLWLTNAFCSTEIYSQDTHQWPS